ncbi:alpha/beta hydrolase [Novosphingobium sp. BW1]|uniref:alpha/beta hydrolase n=1 Tax=Novosphingobium sp. BW1 TaxID=2592621 RepID=UPI001396B966|nr:alpha/beta hydrolase [Novosphingobium sp. BW1]
MCGMVRHGTVALALALASPVALAAPYEAQMYAAPDRAPDFADIEYAQPQGKPLKLDIYLPQNEATDAGADVPPLVVLIHGGGWRIGSKEQFRHMAERFAEQGFAAITIDYRLTDTAPFPAQLHDCKAAIRWARVHAKTYGWAPARIAVLGDSSGAQLAALAGLTGGVVEKTIGKTTLNIAGAPDDGPGLGSRIQAVVDFFGYTDFRVFSQGRVREPRSIPLFFAGSAKDKPDLAELASPLLHVTPDAPPFFIGQGRADAGMHIQSMDLVWALDKAKVPYSLYVVGGGGHGDDAFYRGDPLAPVFAFLRTTFNMESSAR